jgi:hypothetical protein
MSARSGILLALALGPHVAYAAADRLAPLLACRALAEAAARLECFDRESAKLAAPAAAATPSAAAAAGTVAPTPLTPEQKFGLDAKAVTAKEAEAGHPRAELDEVGAKLTALNALADGRVVYTLDNGQVWRSLSPGPDVLLAVGDSVRITRGVLGSYSLVLKSGRTVKVMRVR